MVRRDCPGSMSVKCIAAQGKLSVNELQEKLEAIREKDFRDRFVNEHGKESYKQLVLGLQQELFSAELLTVSRWAAFFTPDARFSQKYLKYSDPDLAVEKTKEMIRQTMELTKELNEELAAIPDANPVASIAGMDASELGTTTVDPALGSASATASPAADGMAEVPDETADISPSFDCAKASTQVEQIICSDRNIASLDRRLAAVYADLRSNEESGDYFRSDQKEWLKKTRAPCTDARCLEEAYSSRIDELETARQYLNKPAEFR